MAREAKNNPDLVSLIADLKAASRNHEAPIWRAVARRLEKPRSRHAAVNVAEIARTVGDDKTVLVPGSVLGAGLIQKSVIVSGLRCSAGAKEKIEAAGGRFISLHELMAWNPTGSGVRVMR